MIKINIKTTVLLSIAILVLTFCKKSNTSDVVLKIDKFPEVEFLFGEPIPEIYMNSKGNVNLCVVDSFLIVQRGENKVIHIYSTNNYKLHAELGTTGRGPNEFIAPELLNQVEKDPINNSPVVNVYDYSRRRFTKINVFNAIKCAEDAMSQESLPKIDSYLNYFFYKDEKSLFATTEDNRFIKYNFKKSEEMTIPLTDYSFLLDDQEMKSVYRPSVFIHRKKKKIVFAPLLLGEIYFFDLEGNHLLTTVFDPAAKEKISIEGDLMNMKYQIIQIRAKGDLIFALNCNMPLNKVPSSKMGFKPKIQVFDWDGLPVKEYILDDERFISSFAVDLHNDRIYGYCPDQLDHSIIVYKE